MSGYRLIQYWFVKQRLIVRRSQRQKPEKGTLEQSIAPGWSLLLVLCLLITACAGNSPPTRYYLLNPDAEGRNDVPSASGDRSLVSLGPVQIPSYLDRPQMIARTAPNRLHLQSFHHWAEPIQETITRVLVQNLAGRLQAAKVVAFPDRFHQSPDFRILVEILRFEPIQSHGRVILKAQWSVREANGGHILCDRTSLFTHTLPDDSPEAIAAAMSQALSDLSTALAQCVQAVRQ